jgi:hypothetical protein
MVTTLSTCDGRLLLRLLESGWCEIQLESGGRITALGADDIDVIRRKLGAALEGPLAGPERGMIDDHVVRWVLSLSENHATVYAADVGEHRRLYFQAGDGSQLGSLGLTVEDRRHWLAGLGEPAR